MGFLSLPEDTVDVEVKDSDGTVATFTLKKALSKSDVNYAFMRVLEATKNFPRRDEETTTASPEAQPLSLDVVMGMPDGQLAILQRSIVGWDLEYPKGHPDSPQPVPLEPEMIDALTSEVVDQLCAKVKELNRTRSVEENRNLGNNSSSTSTIPSPSLPS